MLYPHKQFNSTMGLLIHINIHKSWGSSTYILEKKEKIVVCTNQNNTALVQK